MTTDTDRKQEAEARAIKANARVVYTFAALAIATSATWLYCGYFYLPPLGVPERSGHVRPTTESLVGHIVFTIRWLIPSALTLVYAMQGVVRQRMQTNALTSLNPGTYSNDLRIWRSFLETTLEQFVLHAYAMIALSTWLHPNDMKLIPLFVALFVVGRVCFIKGYLVEGMPYRPYRAFGFNMTQWPTVGVLVYCLYRLGKTMWWDPEP